MTILLVFTRAVYGRMSMGASVGVMQPDLQHVGVRDGDAAVRPVAVLVIGRRVTQIVGQPVNHDLAARRQPVAARALQILVVGVGDLDRQEVLAARIAPGQLVVPFGRTEVAFLLLGAHRDSVPARPGRSATPCAAVHQIQAPLGFAHHDPIGEQRCGRRVADPWRWRQSGSEPFPWRGRATCHTGGPHPRPCPSATASASSCRTRPPPDYHARPDDHT